MVALIFSTVSYAYSLLRGPPFAISTSRDASAWKFKCSEMTRASSLRSSIARFHDLALPARRKCLLRGEEGFDIDALKEADRGGGGRCLGKGCVTVLLLRGVSGAVLECSSGSGLGLFAGGVRAGLPWKLDLADLFAAG